MERFAADPVGVGHVQVVEDRKGLQPGLLGLGMVTGGVVGSPSRSRTSAW